jgi:hypothetical protein
MAEVRGFPAALAEMVVPVVAAAVPLQAPLVALEQAVRVMLAAL